MRPAATPTDAQQVPPPGAVHSQSSALDLLRALAAATVMLAHVRGASFVDYAHLANPSAGAYAFFFLTRIAHEAVMVFFVLSGFLVGGRVLQRVRDGRFDAVDYALDRSTRILLPLIPACILTAAAAVAVGAPASPWQVAGNAIGLNGVLTDTLAQNAPLWSLAYEIWFYIAAGAGGMLMAGKSWRWLGAVLLALAVVVFARLGQVQYALFWMLGAACALIVEVRRGGLLALAGAALAGAGVLLYELGSASQSSHVVVATPPAVAEAMVCIGVCAMLPFACGAGSRALRPLAPLLTFLGGFSYSLYLVHMPLVWLMTLNRTPASRLDAGSIGVFALRIMVCIGVAVVFYFLFEKRTGQLRRWLRSRSAVRSPKAA